MTLFDTFWHFFNNLSFLTLSEIVRKHSDLKMKLRRTLIFKNEADILPSSPVEMTLWRLCQSIHELHELQSCLFQYRRAITRLYLSLSSDLFKYRFVNCKLINSTFLHNKEGCMLDFSDDFNNAYMIYFVNFLGTLAVLPGNIVSALLMDKIGRLRMLGK